MGKIVSFNRKTILTLLLFSLILIASSCTSPVESVSAILDRERSQGVENVTAAPPTMPQFEGEFYPSQELLATLYDQTLPAVVDIEVVSQGSGVEQNIPFPFPFGLPDNLPQAPNPLRGEGSGFIYDNEGHIVTNHHVVDNAEEIVVHFYNGWWAYAELVASDPQADLAVIKVDLPDNLDVQPLRLADLSTLDEGHWVVAFGTPFGLEGSMTLGIVSAIGRGMSLGNGSGPRYTLPDVIQTDAAINPGNSGGPLVNLSGEVVGVNFAINSPVRANSGVGFAIPAGIVARIVPALIEDGAYRYPYLGISGGTVTPQLAKEEKLPDNVLGAWVGEVTEDGPAANGGVERGDIVVELNGTPIQSFDDLVSALINTTEPDQEVPMVVLRNEEEIELVITIGERPADVPGIGETPSDAIEIAEAIEIARETVLSSGLLAEIDSTSAELRSSSNQTAWEVKLSGDGKTATVIVDAATGEVKALNVQ